MKRSLYVNYEESVWTQTCFRLDIHTITVITPNTSSDLVLWPDQWNNRSVGRNSSCCHDSAGIECCWIRWAQNSYPLDWKCDGRNNFMEFMKIIRITLKESGSSLWSQPIEQYPASLLMQTCEKLALWPRRCKMRSKKVRAGKTRKDEGLTV